MSEAAPALASSSSSKTMPMSTLPKYRQFLAICPQSTRAACNLHLPAASSCNLVHFNKKLQSHSDERLGDCSYLNTCHRTDTCRYIHYTLESPNASTPPHQSNSESTALIQEKGKAKMLPPQWINFDLRKLDVSVLGKFDVLVADPPWAIHQELPYGTLTDDEMMRMPIGAMQEEGGLIFLWVTGRAMELGRECLDAWGYERIDELVWVKTNQLQGLIRTGRTGHWLNHSKEHCIVAIRKSSTINRSPEIPKSFKKGLDTQVLLAEVRETSRKPDELYEMVERILEDTEGGGRKCELFGRQHNLRSGWLTIGNQFGRQDQILEKEMLDAFNLRYPDRAIKARPIQS